MDAVTHELRQAILKEWRAVLDDPDPGPAADFFLSGGDSLAAVELVERLEANLGLQLSIADVLVNSTIEDLVHRLAAVKADPGGMADTRAEVISVRQLKMLRTIRAYPAMGESRRVPYVFEISSEVDVHRLADALVMVVNAEPSLLSRFLPEGDDWRLVIDEPHRRDDVVQIVDVADDDLAAAVETSRRPTMRPGDPQIRFSVLRRQGANLLVAVFSHLVYDGMSLPIFLRRLSSAYETGKAPATPTPDYLQLATDWHRQHDTNALAEDEAFWRDHVARYGMWSSVTLPTLRQTRPMTALPCVELTVRISAAQAAAFQRWCDASRVPLFHGLMTTATQAIMAISPQEPDFGVEIETTGRLAGGSTSVVGLFTDYVGIGLHGLPEEPDMAAREIHARTIEAVRHGVYPRHLLTGMTTELMPHRANWLFRMDFDEKRQIIKASGGRLRPVETFDSPQSARVLPGFRLSTRRLDEGGLDMTIQVAEGDLAPSVINDLMAAWGDGVRKAGGAR